MLLVALLACTTTLTACGGGTQTAKSGDTVKVRYVLTLDNGSVFQTSTATFENTPFVIGSKTYMDAFEDAVINMSVNQSKTIHISAEDGYGPIEVTYNLSATDTPPTLGQQYTFTLENGRPIPVIATNVTNTSVTFKNTYPLAGQNLTFKITLLGIISSK